MIALLFVPYVEVQAESSLQKLDQLADEALQMTKIGRYEEAKKLLKIFEKEFTDVAVKERPFSMDELRVLTAVHNQAVEAVTSVEMLPDKRINRLTTFRLVMDAFLSEYQPLWTGMEAPVMKAFQQIKAAALHDDQDAYHFSLNRFLEKYAIIQPSLKIDLSVEKMQQLDAKIMYIDRYRAQMLKRNTAMKELEKLETDLVKLFQQSDEDETDPSLFLVMITTGSIILLTLSYVSWRKYRGQKEKKERTKQKDER